MHIVSTVFVQVDITKKFLGGYISKEFARSVRHIYVRGIHCLS